MSLKYGCTKGKVPKIPYYVAFRDKTPVKVHPHSENTPILYGIIRHINHESKTFVLHRNGHGADVHVPYEKYDVYNGTLLPQTFPQTSGTSIILNHTILIKERESWVDSLGLIYHSEDVYALISSNPYSVVSYNPI